MLRIFLITVFACHCHNAIATLDQVHALKITYKVFVENVDKLGMYRYSFPFEEVHIVSDSRILAIQKFNNSVENEVRIYDLEDKTYFSCFFNKEGDKIAAKELFAENVKIDQANANSKKYQIAGMLCQKNMAVQDGQEMEIYTTDYFGIDFCPYSAVSGYALQYSYYDERFGKITFQAQKVLPTQVEYSIFSLAGFRIQNGSFKSELLTEWDEVRIKKESSSLYDLHSKKINYNIKSISNQKLTSKTQFGKITVLNFKGNYPFYQIEQDLFTSLSQKYKSDKVEFYSVSQGVIDDRIPRLSLIRKAGLIPASCSAKMKQHFKIEYFPTVIIMDKSSRIILYKIGYDAKLFSEMDKAIEGALSQK